MIDLSQYDNEGKKEVFYNEDEEILSKEESQSKNSKPILDEAEESENVGEEDSEESDEMNPAKNVIGYDIEGNEDIGELLAQDEEDNTKIDKLNQLLFCCQGIGKHIKNNKNEDVYEKNEYCIPSLKDIHKFLRTDSKETQVFKRAIISWNLVENDLIPCLLQYEDDEKISQIILIILVDITEELDDNVEGRKELEFSLAKLVEILIKEKVVEFISRKLNTATGQFDKVKTLREKYKQMELEEQKRLKEEKEKEKKEKENEIKQEENNNNKDIIMNDNEEKKEEKNDDNNNNENEKIEVDEESKTSSDKKLDTTEETKKILLHQIAQMEYKSKNLIELLFVLLKQISSISNTSDLNDSSKLISLLLSKFTELHLYDAFLYYISTFNDIESYPFTKEVLSPYLLSILYNIIRPFTPKSVKNLSVPKILNKHSTINENEGKELMRLAELERQDFLQRKMLFSSRGHTYNYRVQINRPIDNSSYFVNNMNQIINKNTANYVKEKANTFKNQRHGGRYRKKTIFKDKKIPKSIIISEIKMINDSKIKNYFSEKSSEISSDAFNPTMVELKRFLVNLMDNESFNHMLDFYYFKFDKDYELEKYDIYYLVNIMSFFIEFNRILNYDELKKNNNINNKTFNFNLKRISNSLSQNMINFMYNFLLTEITKTEKDERKGFVLFPLLNYLKICVYSLMDSYKFSKNNLSEEHDNMNLTLNVMLQDSLLTKDYSKIISNFFEIYNEIYYPIEYLYDIIEFSEIYFSALEYFVNKRELKIKTIKHKRKKKSKKNEVDEEQEILAQIEKDRKKKYKTEDLDDNLLPIKKEEKFAIDDNSDSYGENDSSLDDNSDAESHIELFREINVNEESKCLVSYEIIDKILSIFKNVSGTLVDNFDLSRKLIELKDNTRGILKYISKLLERIAIKSKCFWIFFNIEYLILFNRLLNEPSFNNEPAYKNLRDTIIKILTEYFTIIQKNKMLPVECLFHIEGISLVEAIMNNYEYPEDKNDNGFIINKNDNEHYYGGLDRKKKKKDEINNFINNQESDGDYDINEEKNDDKDKEDSGEEQYYKPGETELFKSQKKKLVKKNKEKIKEEENNEEKKEIKVKWNKDIDQKLIEYYFANINEEKSNKDEIINNLINNELKEFNIDNISKKDIKHRLHKLKVHKGQKKAMKKLNKIYHISNIENSEENSENESKKSKKKLIKKNQSLDLLPNYILKLAEKATDNEYKNNLYNCIDFIIEQLESYKNKIDILGETDVLCELIPTSQTDMNLLKDEDIKNILFSLGFYYNNDTEYITLEKDKIPEISFICQRVMYIKNIIDENIEQDQSKEEIRNKEKEKYVKMQKKKHNNSKKLRDYILTEEEAAKEREKELAREMEKEKDNNLDNNNDFIIKSKKKKKKLIKKNRDLDLIKEEENEEKSKSNSESKNVINDE